MIAAWHPDYASITVGYRNSDTGECLIDMAIERNVPLRYINDFRAILDSLFAAVVTLGSIYSPGFDGLPTSGNDGELELSVLRRIIGELPVGDREAAGALYEELGGDSDPFDIISILVVREDDQLLEVSPLLDDDARRRLRNQNGIQFPDGLNPTRTDDKGFVLTGIATNSEIKNDIEISLQIIVPRIEIAGSKSPGEAALDAAYILTNLIDIIETPHI